MIEELVNAKENGLHPCPFCDNEELNLAHKHSVFSIACKCGCDLRGYESWASVFNLWNNNRIASNG